MRAAPQFATEPNVTPMIDVLLVLLIVFMLAVVQQRRAMDVQLPETCAASCAAGSAIVLEVLPGATYRVNQRAIAHDALAQYLTGVYRERANKVLSVAGRLGTRYADVFEAMDIARSAGVRVISAVPKGF
jgi:biopolymer transport protein ExbD